MFPKRLTQWEIINNKLKIDFDININFINTT